MPRTTPPRRRPALVPSLIPVAALLVAATLGLAACGGSSSTTTTTNAAATTAPAATAAGPSSTGTTDTGTTSTGPTGTTPGRPNPARFSAVRECLAKKGIALPQRTPGRPGGFLGGAGGSQLPKGVTRTRLREALRSCGGGFAGGRLGSGRGAFTSPRFHAALVRFATCLRQNGVDVGEPNTSGKGPVFDTKGINTGSPQFKAASAKCRSVLFAGPRGPRATPGAAGAPGAAAG